MTLPWYNLMFGIGLILAVLDLETVMRARSESGRFPRLVIFTAIAVLVGWASGHLGDYLVRGYIPHGDPIAEHGRFGYMFYGGLVGTALFFCVCLRFLGLRLAWASDRLAPSIPLVHAFGRLGCLLTGCCHGREIAVGGETFAVPVQLLEAILLFALFAWLRRGRFEANRFILYLLVYAPARFCLEFLRGDDRGVLATGFLSPAQEISIVLVALGLLLSAAEEARKRKALDNVSLQLESRR